MGSSNPQVQAIEKNLLAAAEIFDQAESLGSGADASFKSAVRAALSSTPSIQGSYPGFGASTGAASFLQKGVTGKISLGELAAASNAALKSAAAQVSHAPL